LFLRVGEMCFTATGKNRAVVYDDCCGENVAGDVGGGGKVKLAAAMYVSENLPGNTRRAGFNVTVDSPCVAYVNRALYFDVAYYPAVYAHGFVFGAGNFRGFNCKALADNGACV
jgi:hypothetical protein